ncbi:MAG: lipoyl(octanoyl) transferase LipB [Bacteroidota bacterium]
MKQRIFFEDLGLRAYQEVWDYQESLLRDNVSLKQAGRAEETRHHLLFVVHPPVYTLGKSGDPQHVLISEEEREARSIQYFHTNRGGDITYHGPGQLVVYPILDLEKFDRDIGKYLRNLEEVVIRLLDDYGLKAERSSGETGVWLEPQEATRARKICAIGVRCSRWISMHGLALNVNPELDFFRHIVPCGIPDKQVTSLKKEVGRPVSMDEVKQKMKDRFAEAFDCVYC